MQAGACRTPQTREKFSKRGGLKSGFGPRRGRKDNLKYMIPDSEVFSKCCGDVARTPLIYPWKTATPPLHSRGCLTLLRDVPQYNTVPQEAPSPKMAIYTPSGTDF